MCRSRYEAVLTVSVVSFHRWKKPGCLFDLQHICYILWTCFSIDNRHSYVYQKRKKLTWSCNFTFLYTDDVLILSTNITEILLKVSLNTINPHLIKLLIIMIPIFHSINFFISSVHSVCYRFHRPLLFCQCQNKNIGYIDISTKPTDNFQYDII
jgi:hypothetical protein